MEIALFFLFGTFRLHFCFCYLFVFPHCSAIAGVSEHSMYSIGEPSNVQKDRNPQMRIFRIVLRTSSSSDESRTTSNRSKKRSTIISAEGRREEQSSGRGRCRYKYYQFSCISEYNVCGYKVTRDVI